jgi:hypothetical protein
MADLLFAVNPTTDETTEIINPDEKTLSGKKVTKENAPKAQSRAKAPKKGKK